jgi:hypothetical protein
MRADSTRSNGDNRREVRCAPGSPLTVACTCPRCCASFSLAVSIRVVPSPQSPGSAPHESPAVTLGTAELAGYSLHREPACWVLVIQGGRALLKPEIGILYVARLLARPNQPVACAALFSEFSSACRQYGAIMELPNPETGELEPVTDGVGSTQSPLADEEAEAREAHSAKLRELKKALDDPRTVGAKRIEAQRLHDELAAFLRRHYRSSPGPGRAVTKAVHRSIQRLCENLRKPAAGQQVPEPNAVAFAAYVEAYILLPSRRYTRGKAGANVRIARGELAGRLLFECPPGHRWSVRL